MNMTEEQAREKIKSLDLSSVVSKLMDTESVDGAGWSKEKAERVEEEYRGFLFVCWKYKDEPCIATVDIDMFWHRHIIFTKKYRQDCDAIFGHFLEHPIEDNFPGDMPFASDS